MTATPAAGRQRTAMVLGGAGLAIATMLLVYLLVFVVPRRAGGVPPATPATTYTVEAAFYRIPAGGAPRERLESGTRLTLGDQITLEFKTSSPVHVYVIDEDEAGHSFALFPLPGLEPRNPIPAGVLHRLPGSRDGQDLSWTVDTPGGREHLMVVASPARLVDFEAEMGSLARPGQMAVPIPDALTIRLRGIGGLQATPQASRAGTADGASAGHLFEMAQRLASRAEQVDGVWIRRIDLENPALP